jgi:hypothetical protein
MAQDKEESLPLHDLVQLKTRLFLRKPVDSSLVETNLSVVQCALLQKTSNSPPLSTITSYSSSPPGAPQSSPGTTARTKKETRCEQWREMEENNSALQPASVEKGLSLSRLLDSTPAEISFGVSQSPWLPTTPADITDHLAVFRPSLQI